jgi:hypothetical protein
MVNHMATIEYKQDIDEKKLALLLEDVEKGIINQSSSRWVILARLRERGVVLGYTQAGRYRKALKDNLWTIKKEDK